jgi:hypothetical protein
MRTRSKALVVGAVLVILLGVGLLLLGLLCVVYWLFSPLLAQPQPGAWIVALFGVVMGAVGAVMIFVSAAYLRA